MQDTCQTVCPPFQQRVVVFFDLNFIGEMLFFISFQKFRKELNLSHLLNLKNPVNEFSLPDPRTAITVDVFVVINVSENDFLPSLDRIYFTCKRQNFGTNIQAKRTVTLTLGWTEQGMWACWKASLKFDFGIWIYRSEILFFELLNFWGWMSEVRVNGSTCDKVPYFLDFETQHGWGLVHIAL